MKELQDIRNKLLRELSEINHRPEECGHPYRFAPGWSRNEGRMFLHESDADHCYIMADTGDERETRNTLRQYVFIGLYYYKGEPHVIGWPSDEDWDIPEEVSEDDVRCLDLKLLTTESLSYVYDAMKDSVPRYEPFAKSVEELPHTALGAASIETIKDEALRHPVTSVSFDYGFPEPSYPLDKPVTTLHELIKAIQAIIQKDFDRCWCVDFHAITDLCIEIIEVENGTAEVTLGT